MRCRAAHVDVPLLDPPPRNESTRRHGKVTTRSVETIVQDNHAAAPSRVRVRRADTVREWRDAELDRGNRYIRVVGKDGVDVCVRRSGNLNGIEIKPGVARRHSAVESNLRERAGSGEADLIGEPVQVVLRV